MKCLLHIFTGGEAKKSVEDPKISLIKLSGLHEKEAKNQLKRGHEETNLFFYSLMFLEIFFQNVNRVAVHLRKFL